VESRSLRGDLSERYRVFDVDATATRLRAAIKKGPPASTFIQGDAAIARTLHGAGVE